MRDITFISDTHGLHEFMKLPGGDILIHCGDMTRTGTLYELDAFASWMKTRRYASYVCVAGNHDICLEAHPKESEGILRDAGITYLRDNEATVEGLRIYGVPYTPPFFNWAFMRNPEEMKDIWSNIPPCLDILITHGPPFQTLDEVERFTDDAIGCQELRDTLDDLKDAAPCIHAFGHIHESAGIEWAGMTGSHTTSINCSVLDAQYKMRLPSGITLRVQA